MAVWGGLGQAATVAQLVGVDVGGLITKIIQAAATARQNKKECDQLARRVLMIAELLPHLQDPEVMRRPEIRRPLTGLDETLREAHRLVTSCQERNVVYRFVMAGRLAERFREIERRIDSYLLVFPFISHIDITRRLDRIYGVLIPSGRTLPAPSASSQSNQLEVSEEVLLRGDESQRFTLAELMAATDSFGSVLGHGGFGRMYKGRLPDGREVAVKHFCDTPLQGNEFLTELTIISPLCHDNIVRLLGWRVVEQEKLSRRSKEEGVSLLVYEYMENGSLERHLFGTPSSSSSPVTTSWKTRMDMLLGVSRAIEYLHSSQPPVIHRDIRPSNILLDSSWAARLSGFDSAIRCYDEVAECSDIHVCGAMGYLDPEYLRMAIVKPAMDVYSFGVVMLEVLTGRSIHQRFEEDEGDTPVAMGLVHAALPLIEAGELGKVLDRRPAAEPTPRQLEAVDLVACTAARCVQLEGKDRPAISDVVANLQVALELVNCRDENGVDING